MPAQSWRVGGIGTGVSTRRSTTCTAESPDEAARACSHARCRHVAEHHLGSRPVALTVIGPPHQPHVDAARRRACATDSTFCVGSAAASQECEAFGRRVARRWAPNRMDAFRRLLTSSTVRTNVLADVTPMRHDATAGLGAGGVSFMILECARDHGSALTPGCGVAGGVAGTGLTPAWSAWSCDRGPTPTLRLCTWRIRVTSAPEEVLSPYRRCLNRRRHIGGQLDGCSQLRCWRGNPQTAVA